MDLLFKRCGHPSDPKGEVSLQNGLVRKSPTSRAGSDVLRACRGEGCLRQKVGLTNPERMLQF